MGGEGSIQSMIASLRNNKNLLRKKGLFKKERSFLNTKKEYYKAAQGNFDIEKISKEELLLIRKKVIHQRKIENTRAWLFAFVVITPIIGYGIYTFNKAQNKIIQQNEAAKDNYLIENINEYNYLIDEGDKWIEKKNWNNAIYRYEKAVKLFPKDFDANYRLALAYSYHCMFKNKDCDIGKKLMERLLKYNPENQDVQKLKTVFTNN